MNKREKYQSIFDFMMKPTQMVFISGPRQSGKTTFAKQQLSQFSGGKYFNWDISSDRKHILQGINFQEEIKIDGKQRSLIILDEIHKFSEWKNFLKGTYDKDKDLIKFLVTGSGRLDFFQKGKDSLAGRYLLFHLWPLTLAEFGKSPVSLTEFEKNPFAIGSTQIKEHSEVWRELEKFTGFPDPFFNGSEKFYRVWSETYRNQLIREDVRQLTRLEKIDLLENLVLLLPNKIGSTISIDNLAKDIGVTFDTVKKWLLVLERFYVIFRLSPWTAKISRAISKEKKLYLFDYGSINDQGAKFENMVAVELLRAVRNWRESGEGSFDLHYVRDRNKNEVDFLISKDKKPFLLIETKAGDTSVGSGLIHIQQKLNVPAILLVNKPGVYKISSNGKNRILVCSAEQWLANLP